MKEAFEKIKERLEEKAEKKEISRRHILRTEGDSKDYCYFNGMVEGLLEAQRIVSEVEAEYINKSTEHINKSSDCSSNWIPVEERLPETDDDVLIYYQYKIMQGVNVVGWKETQGVGYYYSPSNDWIFYGGFGLDRHAIAWMPLPEPYRRKEQG